MENKKAHDDILSDRQVSPVWTAPTLTSGFFSLAHLSGLVSALSSLIPLFVALLAAQC